MPSKKCIISVKDLVKKFDNFEAVKDVSLCINKGEIFGLLGPNGAGKTTFLSVLATTLQANGGSAMVNGFDVSKNPDGVRKSIGMSFQDNSLDLDLTAKENLWFHCRMYHIPESQINQKISQALKLADLEQFADREIKKYSGGMKRRLEIVRALMHEPKILFLDEPTLGLDPQTRRALWEKIKELNEKNGMTIILTTHYMEEANELCDRIAIIDKGKIVALGTSQELKKSVKGDIITLETKNNQAFAGKKFKFVKDAKIHDGEVSLTVDSAEKRITEIVLFAKKSKIQIDNINLKKPSLEDVFLHFTGKTIREAELGAEGQFAERFKASRLELRAR